MRGFAEAGYVHRLHKRDAHGGGPHLHHYIVNTAGPWMPPQFRPTALDYELMPREVVA